MTNSDNQWGSAPLKALDIAGHLFPSFAPKNNKDPRLDVFLLWPPDLFAFTSSLLSITGAYHLVVSPPATASLLQDLSDIEAKCTSARRALPDFCKTVRGFSTKGRNDFLDWPSTIDLARAKASKEGKRLNVPRRKESWAETTKQLAGRWRINLQNAGTRRPFEKSLNSHRTKLAERQKRNVRLPWVPGDVVAIWHFLTSQFDGEGNVFDILCAEKKSDGGLPPEKELDERIESLWSRSRHWLAFQAVLTLHAIADEACVGFGIRHLLWQRDENGKDDFPPPNQQHQCSLFEFVDDRLRKEGTLSLANTSRARILPKRHTPRVGITLRSISNNISYHRSSVEVKWTGDLKAATPLTRRLMPTDGPRSLSILLLPWPMTVSSADFRTSKPAQIQGDHGHLFRYEPQEPFPFATLVDAIQGASRETGRVDMVVLPESAIGEAEIPKFEGFLNASGVVIYVAGVRGTLDGDSTRDHDQSSGAPYYDLAENSVHLKMATESESGVLGYSMNPEKQNKHHRWKLDRSQIKAYNLGHTLPSVSDWWEGIRIPRRRVTFVNLGSEMTICPLICEDLARQDPIADLLRTVGPSMVVTILMDGPQFKDRWSARYATVLAEDPGCAVVALSSYGMVRRWQPPFLPLGNQRHVVALWNDGQGDVRELALEDQSVGILLTVTLEGKAETTADGRSDLVKTNTLTLGGVHQVRTGPRRIS